VAVPLPDTEVYVVTLVPEPPLACAALESAIALLALSISPSESEV
jgi:hypothetical protein